MADIEEKTPLDGEEGFRNLAEMTSAGIFIFQNADMCYVNPAAATITGFTADELTEMQFWDIIHPDSQPLIKLRGIARQQGDGVPDRYEVRIITKSGEERWVDFTGNVIDLRGEPAILGTVLDITERKQAEEKFRAQLRRNDQILRTTMDGYILADTAGKLIEVNRAYCKKIGYSRVELLEMNIVDLEVQLGPAEIERRIEAMVKHGHVRFDTRHRCKDGRIIDLDVSIVVMDIDKGPLIAAFMRDVTERRQAEEALKKSEERFRILFEDSKDVIFFCTPDGKYVDINPAGVKLFGYSSRDELLQVDIASELFVEARDHEVLMEQLVRRGFVMDHELVFTKKNGDMVNVLMTATVVRSATGVIELIQGVIRDVTEQKKLQAQFLQAQKMETIGVLAGGVAHDFNNILTVIRGYSQLGLEGAESDSAAGEWFSQIDKAAIRATSLTQHLLSFSRRGTMTKKVIDLNRTIEDLMSMLIRILGEDVDLNAELSEEPLMILADPSQVQQVLMNLLTNARDAMSGGGTVMLKTRAGQTGTSRGVVNAARTVRCAEIVIEDSGVGISATILPNIFDPFFTTKEVGKGTGLGLAVVYGIVEEHGGQVEIKSEVGKGTSVSVSFPIDTQLQEQRGEEEGPAIVCGRGETILLVEDDRLVRQVTMTMLETLGYEVLSAEGGKDAAVIFAARKDDIDLVMLDVVMPGESGPEVYAAMSRQRASLPVLFVTGYDMESKLGEFDIGREGASFAVLQKPFTRQSLGAKVSALLKPPLPTTE